MSIQELSTVELLAELHRRLDDASPVIVDTPNIKRITGSEAPWVLKMLEFEGKSEVYDEEELKAFLGFNPNGNDPDGKSWCAGFLDRCLTASGCTPANTLSAASFASYGHECSEVDGAIMVFGNSSASKYNISHVGVKLGDQLLGGNQGDSVRKSNLAWYKQHASLIACRCPEGYELV